MTSDLTSLIERVCTTTLVLLSLGLSTPSLAESSLLPMPPAAWLYRPDMSPADNNFWSQELPPVIHVVSNEMLRYICAAWIPANHIAFGCTFIRRAEHKCDIYIGEDVAHGKALFSFNTILIHEFAHCRGWPATHPQTDPPEKPTS